MRIFFKVLIISCITLLINTNVIGQSFLLCGKAKNIIFKFVESEGNTDWDEIEVNAYKLQRCKCEIAPVFYYIERMKVLLPNSQVLQGISPEDSIANHKLKMNEQISILKSCDMTLYLPLINTMLKQNFDSEISDTARELIDKLEQNTQ